MVNKVGVKLTLFFVIYYFVCIKNIIFVTY